MLSSIRPNRLRPATVALASALALALTACGGTASPPAQSGSPAASGGQGPSIERLANNLGPDRQKILEDGARKEGKLSFYTSSILTSATGDIIKKFEAKYPFVKVDVYRADNTELDNRVIQEYAAKQYLVDAFETTSEGLLPLKNRNVITTFNSPEAAAFIDEAKVKGTNGFDWIVVRESYHGIGWNTKLVKEEDVPKNHDEILNPRWTGMFSVPDNFDNTIGAYEQAKGVDFIKKLGALKIRYQKVSARQLADMVISGEVPISLDLASAHVTDSQGKGAPIAWRALEPVPTNDGSLALAAKPPHPYAALLYIDFALSKNGAESYDKFGYGTDRSDFNGKYSLPASEKRFYGSRAPNFEQKLDEWHKLMLQITTQ